MSAPHWWLMISVLQLVFMLVSMALPERSDGRPIFGGLLLLTAITSVVLSALAATGGL